MKQEQTPAQPAPEPAPNDCMKCGTINCPHNGKSNIANCHFWMSPDVPEPAARVTDEPAFTVGQIHRYLRGFLRFFSNGDECSRENTSLRDAMHELNDAQDGLWAVTGRVKSVRERIKEIK